MDASHRDSRRRLFKIREYLRYWLLIYCAVCWYWMYHMYAQHVAPGAQVNRHSMSLDEFICHQEYMPPILPEMLPQDLEPIKWIARHTLEDGEVSSLSLYDLEDMLYNKPKAAFIALVRNSEEAGILHSIAQVEARFNNRKTHRYDWVLFNDEPFTDSFKAAIGNATGSRVYFEQVSSDHWRVPDWVDLSRYNAAREFQGGIGVGKAWLKSYHLMIRWYSGLFALEDRLKDYSYYWRIEPDVSMSFNL